MVSNKYWFLKSGVCGHTWNGGSCCLSLDDDETFLDNVIEKSVEKLMETGLENAKLSKLYFLGFSAGAVMSQRLACTRSQKIAGIASVSGVLAFDGKFSSQR